MPDDLTSSLTPAKDAALRREFDDELSVLKDLLGATPFVGCNTYGQVARTEGQFSGFHNCTAVVCVFAA